MKIIPFSDIAILGVHCPEGIAVDVPAEEASSLIAQRAARRATGTNGASSAITAELGDNIVVFAKDVAVRGAHVPAGTPVAVKQADAAVFLSNGQARHATSEEASAFPR